MKRIKCISRLLLSLLMAVLLLPTSVLAQGKIDLQQGNQLHLVYTDHSTPLAGAVFDLHFIADVDEYGNFTVTDTFKDYPILLTQQSDKSWKELASTLEGYILRDDIVPMAEEMTDETGSLYFSDHGKPLPAGLYLVSGYQHIQNQLIYTAEPFLVMLPIANNETNDWNYEVDVYPKNSSIPVPEEPVNIKVLKVWNDNGSQEDRPQEITIALLCDGEVHEEVVLHKENHWKYTWEGLAPEHSWTVVEKEVAGYTTTVTREGITFVVTNTPKKENHPITPEKDPTLPSTGQLWWPVPILLCAGLLFVVIGLLRRRGAGYEK